MNEYPFARDSVIVFRFLHHFVLEISHQQLRVKYFICIYRASHEPKDFGGSYMSAVCVCVYVCVFVCVSEITPKTKMILYTEVWVLSEIDLTMFFQRSFLCLV